MKSPFRRERRFAVAIVACIIAAFIFRSAIADGLVIRGDDLAYQGRSSDALSHYARALWMDPSSEVAADRYTFTLIERHTSNALYSAITAANAFLSRNPNDAAILEDRAICYLMLHRYRQAEKNFGRSARISADPRVYVFAASAALHAGRLGDAKVFWHRALALDRTLKAAKLALESHGK
jgi:tetratricopeptide (TPR) repeat protein